MSSTSTWRIRPTIACFLILTACVVGMAAGEQVDGKVLSISSAHEGNPLTIQWQAEDGVWASEPRYSRKGTHLYELRHNPRWCGAASNVCVDGVPVLDHALVTPTLLDEWRLFLTPEPWTSASIGFLYGHSVGGVDWGIILLGLFFALTAIIVAMKRSLTVALVSSLITVSVVTELRSDYDHLVAGMRAGENATLRGTLGLKRACTQASTELISETWTAVGLPPMIDHLIAYHLAEITYVSEESAADYVVSFSDHTLLFQPRHPE